MEKVTDGDVHERRDALLKGRGLFGTRNYMVTEVSGTRPSELMVAESWVSSPQTEEQTAYAEAESVYRSFVYDAYTAADEKLLPALIVLAVSAALMALLTRRDARLLRTSVRVKSGGREGETVPMTFTFAPKRRLLALAPVPAVLIVTGFRGYIAGGRAWLNAMLDRWNTVHEGGLALFSGTASERDVWAFALLAAVLIGLLTWYAVSRQSSRLAAFISVFWLLLSLFGEGFYPLALVLLTAGQLGLHMTSGSRAITRRAVAWCLEISAVLCACARWS